MFADFAKVAGFTVLAMGLASAQKDTINVLKPYEVEQGFVQMFDSTAASFRGLFANYAQNNTTSTTLGAGWGIDTVQTDPERPGAFFRTIVNGTSTVDTRSRRLYRDFDFRMEYRNSGNQGVIYRFNATGSYNYSTGVELAIDDNVTQSTLKFRAGAAYDMYAPSVQAYFLRNTNKWNSLRIVAKADSVEHWMNGIKVVSFRYWSPEFLTIYQGSKWAGVNQYCQTAPNNRTYIPAGYIGFQADHGGAWQMRRIRILHDSASTIDRVKLGPVDTTYVVGVQQGGSVKAASHRIEQLAGGLQVSTTDGSALRAVEVRGLDGRQVGRFTPVAGSTSYLLTRDNLPNMRQGVYVLRLETSTGVYLDKALIQ